ncbi:MAG: response regulator [Dehalococcoidia bacterium]|jgi:DNA-binding response OmpR family regulator
MTQPKGQRILVVEDEPSICQVCLRTLTAEGFEVDIAVNGAIAGKMIGKTDYDLCLIDIRTPVMNGKELYQYIMEKHPDFSGKIIFTTGDVLDDKLVALFKGIDRPYLPKPFTPDELKAIVKETLEG